MKLFFFILIMVMTFSVTAYADPAIVGNWGVSGDVMYNFKADGTGSSEGLPFRWKTSNGVLYLTADGETEQVRYQVQGNTLVLSVNGFPMTLDRIGKGPEKGTNAKSGKGSATSPGQNNPNTAGNDKLSKLLLSSPWCSFSYNQNTGYSHTKRVQFYKNGTWSDNSRGEGYSSGYGGTMASQHDSGR